jgi:hypothetical protein
MSTIEIILSRMMNDPAFADVVFADAEKALDEYDLAPEEITTFKKMQRIDLDAFLSASPDERKSFVFVGTANGGVWKTTNGG